MHRALFILEEWHLWQIAAQVFLRVCHLISVDTGVGQQVSDWLGLSSDIKVPENWFIQLDRTVLGTSLSSLQLILQFLNCLFVSCNDALLLVYFLLEFRDLSSRGSTTTCTESSCFFNNIWCTGSRFLLESELLTHTFLDLALQFGLQLFWVKFLKNWVLVGSLGPLIERHSCRLGPVLWIQVSTELLFLSWYSESNELCFLASESETSHDFLPEWVNCLLWQKVEIVSAYFTIVVAEWNKLRLFSTLTRLTEVKHLCEG